MHQRREPGLRVGIAPGPAGRAEPRRRCGGGGDGWRLAREPAGATDAEEQEGEQDFPEWRHWP